MNERHEAATRWDQRYSEPGYAYGTEPNAFLTEVADRLPPGRALSLAEGEGRNGVFLAERGFEVTGVDSSAVGLAKAQALAAERGVSLTTVPADLAHYTIAPGDWDLIVSIFCHLPAVLRRRLYAQAVAGLKPGGTLVLEAYTPRQLEFATGGPKDAALLVTLEELRRELAGLHFDIARETVRDVREGRCHTGRGAVVQILARRPAAPRH